MVRNWFVGAVKEELPLQGKRRLLSRPTCCLPRPTIGVSRTPVAGLLQVCAHCLLAFCRVCRFEELAPPSCLLLTFFYTTNAHSFVWTTSTGSGSNPALKQAKTGQNIGWCVASLMNAGTQVKTAFLGVAAVDIGGSTLCKLFDIPTGRRNRKGGLEVLSKNAPGSEPGAPQVVARMSALTSASARHYYGADMLLHKLIA